MKTLPIIGGFLLSVSAIGFAQPTVLDDDELVAPFLVPLIASMDPCKALVSGLSAKIDVAFGSLKGRYPNVLSMLATKRTYREGIENMRRDAARDKGLTPEACASLPIAMDLITPEFIKGLRQVQIPMSKP